jgi:hypothetical protein
MNGTYIFWLFKFFYLRVGSNNREGKRFFIALVLEKLQFCQEVSRYFKKILSTTVMEKG